MRIHVCVVAMFLTLATPAYAEWPMVDAVVQPLVEQGQLSGAVTLVVRDGDVVHSSVIGKRDIETGAPMEIDTIFRLYSMAKPATAVAMMILYDEGRWKPEDPVAKFVPELADLKLLAGADAEGKPLLVAPKTQPTMVQVMTHTAGFTYGSFDHPDIDALFRASSPMAARSGDEFARRLAALPLDHEPGTLFEYSLAVELQGLI